MLYSNEDEQTRSTCFNTGDYHKHNREERKRVTDDYLQCSSTQSSKAGKTGQRIKLFRNTFKVGKKKSKKTSNTRFKIVVTSGVVS